MGHGAGRGSGKVLEVDGKVWKLIFWISIFFESFSNHHFVKDEEEPALPKPGPKPDQITAVIGEVWIQNFKLKTII